MTRKSKAEQWAGKTPLERATVYENMRDHLRSVADMVGGAEGMHLHIAARSMAGSSAAVRAAESLRTSCCWQSATFGQCAPGGCDGKK